MQSRYINGILFRGQGNIFSTFKEGDTVVSALVHAPRERQKACAKANRVLRDTYNGVNNRYM